MQRMGRLLAALPMASALFFATVAACAPGSAQSASIGNASDQIGDRVWDHGILHASTEELVRDFLPDFPQKIVSHDWMRLSAHGPRYLSLYEEVAPASEWACVQKIHKMVFWSLYEIYPERGANSGIVQTNRYEDATYQISEAGQCDHSGGRIAGFSAHGVDVSNALRSYQAAVDDGDVTIQCDEEYSECISLLSSFDLRSLRSIDGCNEPHCLARFDFPPSATTVKASPYGWVLKLYEGPAGRRIDIRRGLQPAVS